MTIRTHSIGPVQQAFITEVVEMLSEDDDLEISARALADAWAMHPSTTRTWLVHAYQLGVLDRRSAPGGLRGHHRYLYRLP